jgi:hypothetical protein
MAKEPFKMKAGKEGPMKKNFPSAFKQDQESVQDNTRTPKVKEAKTKPKDFDSSRKGDEFGSYEDYLTLKKNFPNADISYDDEFLKNFNKYN